MRWFPLLHIKPIPFWKGMLRARRLAGGDQPEKLCHDGGRRPPNRWPEIRNAVPVAEEGIHGMNGKDDD